MLPFTPKADKVYRNSIFLCLHALKLHDNEHLNEFMVFVSHQHFPGVISVFLLLIRFYVDSAAHV